MQLQAIDQFRYHHVLADTPGVALVVFTSPDCGACRAWKAIVRDLVGDGETPAITAFEVDAQRDPALAREFDVFHLPALFLYRDGRFHCALQSEASRSALRRSIDAALMRPADDPP